MPPLPLHAPPQDQLALAKLCDGVVQQPPASLKALRKILRQHPKSQGGFFSKAEIIRALRNDFPKGGDEKLFWSQASGLLKKPTRTLSGVTPVTVLTKPHPCPGKCVFCPNDVRMPKSYLFNEPGSRRAWDNGFDPYAQVLSRLTNFWQHGHATDKIELIILGGTFTFYPETYQRYFVGRCFEALNDFAHFNEAALYEKTSSQTPHTAASPDEAQRRGKYNAWVGKVFADNNFDESNWAHFTWDRLAQAHGQNETSPSRCVGLVVETRPEEITESKGHFLRRLGCTKIQIGLQSNDDAILEKNKRGHQAEDNKKACELLRRMGFKIHAHVMMNLLGATPKNDLADFQSFFDDERLRPDELKIYPCALVEDTELFDAYEQGQWHPYAPEVLNDLLEKTLLAVPAYCRVSRMIRDFSAGDIVAGNKKANLRQIIQNQLHEKETVPVEIRSREIRDKTLPTAEASLSQIQYNTGNGREVFLQTTTPENKILAYLRLSLPTTAAPFAELEQAALVREVHVYGKSLSLNGNESEGSQHRGYGERLLLEAAKIAKAAGFSKLSVISGVGTRAYYRKKGFSDGTLYQHQRL